jgi:hypothetical protein
MKTKYGIIFILGFIAAFFAATFYKDLDKVFYFMMQDKFNNNTKELIPDGIPDYSIYYKLIAITISCYTYVIYGLVKGKWSIVALVIFLTALNSLVDELFFNPTIISINEYIGFSIIILLAYLFRNKWTK